MEQGPGEEAPAVVQDDHSGYVGQGALAGQQDFLMT